MKRLAMIMIGCAVMFSCGDTFVEDMKTESLAVRQKEGMPSLVMSPTIISFTEGMDPVANAARMKVHLTAPPESEVVLDLSEIAERGLTVEPDKVVFTPGNYSEEQEITVGLSNDNIANYTRHYSVSLPKLESLDPLYNAMATPVIEITIFEDDFLPTMYPITPYNGETDIALFREIKVQFDRPEMDTDSIGAHTTIKDSGNNTVPFIFSFDQATQVATFSLYDFFRINSEYTVTMDQQIHEGGHKNRIF